MKTNMLFDEAWHELHDARRAENINEVIAACARLQRAARMMKLDKQQEADEVCDHRGLFDERGVCSRCGYNASQWPQPENH